VSHSFVYMPKSGIAESNGKFMFRFLGSLQIFLQSGCTSLRSHQQCIRVPFSPHPVVSGVANDGYFNRGEVESYVILICISFMARDGEHLFMCFLAI
jgi:hypothetical protein